MPVDEGFQIRRYVGADCGATLTVFQRAVREVSSRDYDPVQIAAWSQVDEVERWRQRRESRPTWVAVLGTSVIGFSDLEPDGHLDMMYVHPEHQGVGVASRLLATVEAEARRLGVRRLFTEASLTAQPFFERRGFRLIAKQQVEARGVWLTNFRMEKFLVGGGPDSR